MQASQASRYLFYVVGEILLVVVGILIALQINNRSEFNKERQKERVILSELKENVAANIAEMDDFLEKVGQHISSIEIIQDAISDNHPLHDSLYKHLRWTMVYSTITFNMGAYESLKMSGLDVLNDDRLRFEITNFFEYEVGQVIKFTDEIRDDFYSYMLDFLRTEFKFFSNQDRKAIPLDFEDLKQNQEFFLSIGIFLDVQIDLYSNLNNCLSSAQSLFTLIDQRLSALDEILH